MAAIPAQQSKTGSSSSSSSAGTNAVEDLVFRALIALVVCFVCTYLWPLTLAAGVLWLLWCAGPLAMRPPRLAALLVGVGCAVAAALVFRSRGVVLDATAVGVLAAQYHAVQLAALEAVLPPIRFALAGPPPTAFTAAFPPPVVLAYLGALWPYSLLGGAAAGTALALGLLGPWAPSSAASASPSPLPRSGASSPKGEDADLLGEEGKEGSSGGDAGASGSRRPQDISTAGPPRPRRWVVPGVIPEGYVTMVYGDGGVGKSLLCVYLGLCAITGTPFAGWPVKKGPILFFDGELEQNEFATRAHAVARGMGLGGVPRGLYYFRLPEGTLLDRHVRDAIRRAIVQVRPWWALWRPFPILYCFDSGTIAGGMGASVQETMVTNLMRFMRSWVKEQGAVVMVDHVTKPPRNGDPREAEVYASRFKHNNCRSSIVIVKASKEAAKHGATVELFHKKSNFGRLFGSRYLAVLPSTREEGKKGSDVEVLEYRHIPLGDESGALVTEDAEATETSSVALPMLPMHAPLSAIEPEPETPELTLEQRVWLALEPFGEEGATVRTLADAMGLAPKTVSNRISALSKSGRVEPCGGHAWRVVAPGVEPVSCDIIGDNEHPHTGSGPGDLETGPTGSNQERHLAGEAGDGGVEAVPKPAHTTAT